MKRRVWRRWPSGEPPVPKHHGRKAAQPTRCPVCDTPLVTSSRLEEGPHGPETVAVTRCPNPACPRAREIRG